MNKQHVVKCLRIANDLWSISGADFYRVRAHAYAAQAIAETPLSISEILALPPGTIHGVGKETLAMVRALQTGGLTALLQRLNITLPAEAAELLQLPGIGPKTANTLVFQLGIYSVEQLSVALNEGRLNSVAGLGTSRRSRLQRDIPVFLERRKSVPIALGWPLALGLQSFLKEGPCTLRTAVTGDFRRLALMAKRIEVVVSAANVRETVNWTQQQLPDAGPFHVDGQGEYVTASTTLDRGGNVIPLSFHITPDAMFAPILMETTGAPDHQAVLKGLLNDQGIEWRDGVLYQNGLALQCESEEDIYALLGLPYLPPALRESRGMLQNPAHLVTRQDIQGDLHIHSNWSDGALPISSIVRIAEELGYEYVAITDHSQSLSIAGGLTPEQLRAQKREIADVQKHTVVRILHGIEVDVLADGQLDLPMETLLQLDLVIASVHSAMHQSREEMTRRLLRAIAHPAVHMIGHLTGRIIGRRAGYEIDEERILKAAQEAGVMLELNANPNRLDISEDLIRRAVERGMLVPINTDAHDESEFNHIEYGIRMAHRGWLKPANVLNTLPYKELMSVLNRKRNR